MLNSRDKNDKTPLHYAATNGNLQVRRFAPENNVGFFFSFKKLEHSDKIPQKNTLTKLKLSRQVVTLEIGFAS